MIYLQLFWEFFKTGLFAIGGGLATLPFLYEMQAKTGWFTLNDLSNLIAISESTPGPMGVNMATYTGFTTAGVLGGFIAVLGLIAPCVIIILIISKFLERFQSNRYVQYALYGLRSASAALILVAGLRVAQAAFLRTEAFSLTHALGDLFSPLALVLGLVLALVYKKTGKHPIFYIVAAGLAGVLLKL